MMMASDEMVLFLILAFDREVGQIPTSARLLDEATAGVINYVKNHKGTRQIPKLLLVAETTGRFQARETKHTSLELLNDKTHQ